MSKEMEQKPSVIYITEEEHRIEWTQESTKELLKFYDEKCDLLETGVIQTQKRVWELVSKEMAKKGYSYTAAQCENKWKTLKRSYRNKLDRLEKYGSSKRPCPFENEISEILSKRPTEAFNKFFYTPERYKLKNQESSLNINLNNPPGFSKNILDNSIKDVNTIHMDDDSIDQLSQNENADIFIQDVNQNLTDEISELRKIINKSNRINSQILQQSTDLQARLLQYFDGAAQRECQILELQETRMEQQNEVIKQMKIQNGLLQKLLDKIG